MSIKEKLSAVLSSEHDDQPIEPYIGPQPFSTEEADQLRFFGRDAEIDEIVALITSHRTVLIYAQSGAGKTSLINAGVIPSLEYDGFEVLPVARVQVTSPTSPISRKNSDNNIPSQIENIYIYNALQSLGREIKPEIKPESISDLALFEFLDKYFPTRKNENGDMRPQVVIFDQLEELFSFYPDNWIEQQRGFFQQVADSLDNNPFLRIVFVIREDFLAQLDPFRSLLPENLRTRFRLERLRRKEAALAIKGPLNKVIDNITEDSDSEINALVNELLKINIETPSGDSRQLEGEFVEPIQLQVVCRRWWRERKEASKRRGNKKTRLEDIGNVDRALEDFYDDAISSASKQTRVDEGKIRIWCQEKLITSSGTRSIAHRGQLTTEGLDNDVIDLLERKYLIRKEWRSGASWYELTHDRLIKPMISSNTRWKDLRNRKNNRKIILTTGLAAAATTALIIAILPIIFPPPPPSFVERIMPVGDSPTKVAVNPNTLYVYVVNAASESISAISGEKSAQAAISGVAVNQNTNSDTEREQQAIPFDAGPQALAVNPNTNTVYVGSYDSGTVSVVDGTTNIVHKTIAIQGKPGDVAVNPNTNTVYVAGSDSGTVSVVDGTRNIVLRTISVGGLAHNVDVNPNTNTVYVVSHVRNATGSYENGIVSVVDGTTNSILRTIPIEGETSEIAVNPNTNTVYVVTYASNATSVIDGRTNSVIGTIPMQGGPTDVFVNPNTNTVYVTSYAYNVSSDSTVKEKVSVINGTTNSIIGTIDVGGTPDELAVHPNTNTVYVTSSDPSSDLSPEFNYQSSTLYAIDGTAMNGTTTTNTTIVGTIPREGQHDISDDVVINPNTNTVYVSSYSSETVYAIDATAMNGTTTNNVAPEEIVMEGVPVDYGDAVAVHPNNNTVYVASSSYDESTYSYENGTVYAIDSTTNTVLRTIRVEGKPTHVAIHPNTNTVYVASDTTPSYYESAEPYGSNLMYASYYENAGPYGSTVNGTVYAIDSTTNTVLRSIPIEGRPADIAIHPNTNTVYVASDESGTVYAIDSTTNTVLRSIPVEGGPYEIDVHANTNTVYVASDSYDESTYSYENGTVYALDSTTNNIVGTVPIEGGLGEVAVNPNTNTVYVTSYDLETVYAIDGTAMNGTTTNSSILKTIDLEGTPSDVAVNPNTNTVYVASSQSETVSVMDGTTGIILRTIPIEGGPDKIAIPPNTNTVYVTSYGSHTLSAIDGTTNTVLRTVPIEIGPSEVDLHPNTNTIYITSIDSETVYAIDGTAMNGTTTNNVAPEEIVMEGAPIDVAVNPNINTVYVADSQKVSAIDGITNYIIGTVPVGGSPTSIAVNPNTNTVYVANSLSNTTSVIDGIAMNGTTTNSSIIGTVPVGGSPIDVAVNPNTNTVYVANSLSNTTSVIDGRTNTVLRTIALDSSPTSIAVNPNTNTVYVANSLSNTTSVIDGRTNTVLRTIALDSSPTSIAVNPNTNTVYVASYDSETISVMDGRTNSILRTITVQGTPSDVAVNPNSNIVYVANTENNNLSIIEQIAS